MGHKFRTVNRSDITWRNVYEIRYGIRDNDQGTRYEISFTIEPPCTTAEAEYSSQGANFELGAVQRRANLVDLETCYNMSLTISKVGFGTTENGPSKVLRVIYGLNP